MPAASKTLCDSCKGAIGKGGSIMCRIWSNWFHSECADFSAKDIAALKAIGKSVYICGKCDRNLDNGGRRHISDDIQSLNKKFDNFITSNQNEQDSIKKVLEEIKTNMTACLNDMKRDILECNKRIDEFASFSSNILDLQVENNILHRRLNRGDIIISGLPENITDLFSVAVGLADHRYY